MLKGRHLHKHASWDQASFADCKQGQIQSYFEMHANAIWEKVGETQIKKPLPPILRSGKMKGPFDIHHLKNIM